MIEKKLWTKNKLRNGIEKEDEENDYNNWFFLYF